MKKFLVLGLLGVFCSNSEAMDPAAIAAANPIVYVWNSRGESANGPAREVIQEEICEVRAKNMTGPEAMCVLEKLRGLQSGTISWLTFECNVDENGVIAGTTGVADSDAIVAGLVDVINKNIVWMASINLKVGKSSEDQCNALAKSMVCAERLTHIAFDGDSYYDNYLTPVLEKYAGVRKSFYDGWKLAAKHWIPINIDVYKILGAQEANAVRIELQQAINARK